MDNGIQQVSPASTALNAEHYQSFDMAKANDDVIGGNDITQIRIYAARTREKAQALHKTIAITSGIEDVAAIKAEATETAQTFAKVSVYADQRIGELLRELPTKQGKRETSPTVVNEVTKTEAIKDAGISKGMAFNLEAMAANPEVVEAVIAKATEEGRIVSRKQVLDAINERKQAERDRRIAEQEAERAKLDAADAYRDAENLEAENDALKRQLAEKPEPKVVEREVERVVPPDDYQELKRRVSSLKRESDIYLENNQSLRSQIESMRDELEKAKDLLGMDKTLQDVRRDVQYLTTATNNYVRRYGGLTWTAQQLNEVDDVSFEQLRKAVRNLATFATALMETLENENGKRTHA